MTLDVEFPPFLHRLARFAADLRIETIPAEVLHQGRLCLLDTIGCIVSGLDSQVAAQLFELECADGAPGDVGVIGGGGQRLQADAAARVHACMGDAFELNDLIGGHASIGSVSAILAWADRYGASGSDMLGALIAGLETTAAVYAGLWEGASSCMKPYDEVGMTPVGIPSTIGIAAGLSRLAGLDVSTTSRAMAIAGALAGWCPAEGVFGAGGSSKLLLFGGWPATVAMKAVGFARAGLTGPDRLLESGIGYWNTVARRSRHDDLAVPGEVWRIAAPRRKRHACCGYFHSAMDLLLDMRDEGIPVDQAGTIRVLVPPYVAPVMRRSPEASAAAEESVFDAYYNLALAAAGVAIVGPEHSLENARYRAQPLIRRLMGCIEIGVAPHLSNSMACTVEILAGDGTMVGRREGAHPRGAPANPLTAEEIEQKFARLVRRVLAPQAIDRFIARTKRIESEPACDWLIETFAAARFMLPHPPSADVARPPGV